jgi:hypothetical protein
MPEIMKVKVIDLKCFAAAVEGCPESRATIRR